MATSSPAPALGRFAVAVPVPGAPVCVLRSFPSAGARSRFVAARAAAGAPVFPVPAVPVALRGRSGLAGVPVRPRGVAGLPGLPVGARRLALPR